MQPFSKKAAGTDSPLAKFLNAVKDIFTSVLLKNAGRNGLQQRFINAVEKKTLVNVFAIGAFLEKCPEMVPFNSICERPFFYAVRVEVQYNNIDLWN